MTGLVLDGLAGIAVPLLVEMVDDRWTQRVGHRLRFVLLVASVAVVGLLLAALDVSPAVIIVGAGLYFLAHFAVLTPYEAL
ncbi:hypothetical protein [Actinomycetospora soli]|uniref:hypothetical protein n=1 Tax=Actinomycetospora soli TaxID=2893887 RepID=UPI001E502289|nr:hypothetical protein [Actinomycetospora soli]MCD2191136.1 hypothetical protein [Actinomycetospora soli]